MPPRHLGTILELLETGECPRECRPALLEVLEAGDPKMKLRALEFTPELIEGDRIALLHVDLVEDSEEETEVRARAAEALGPALERAGHAVRGEASEASPLSREGYRSIQQRLESFYRSASAPDCVRRRVLATSARAPEQWHRGAIRAAWNSDDPKWRRTAVSAMERLSGFREPLAEALRDDDPKVVCRALRAAAGRDDIPGATEIYIEYALDDTNRCECRIAAIEGLRLSPSKRALEALERLRHCPTDEIAGTATWALDEWRVYNQSS